MKVDTILTNGLSHEMEVTIPADEIQRRIEARLRDVGRNVKLKGFRKGKIPRRILDHRYGASVRGEIIERTVNETLWRVLREKSIRPATKPQVELAAFEDGMDLIYTVKVESMPELDLSDLEGLSLTRKVAQPEPEWLESQLQQLQSNYLAEGDEMLGTDPSEDEINTGLARSLGAESYAALSEILQKEQQRELDGLSRLTLKRDLFDTIDQAQAFQLPPGMAGLVDLEYDNIKRQVELEDRDGDEDFELTEEERQELREIAERRVRLGMVVAELSNRLNISITEAEYQQAVHTEALKYPGQEQDVRDHFDSQPAAQDSMRGTLLEDKVIDHILASADITDQRVSSAELLVQSDDEE